MLKNITKEIWDLEMEKYKGCSPNRSNSDFEQALVNFFVSYDDCESLDNIESDLCQMIKEINKSSFSVSSIKDIYYDIDEKCKIGFVDILLKNDISYDDFKVFLKYINKNFN